MNFLINCSNLKNGGGLQVADSVCNQLYKFLDHKFIVILSSHLSTLGKRIRNYPNVIEIQYDIKNSISILVFGKNSFLDNIVKKYQIDAVITLFGPSRWQPKVPHICGFARAQLLLTDSPYYNGLTLKDKLIYKIWTYYFKKSSNIFYTENPFISEKLPGLLGNDIKVYTVTNYYNQVFDLPSEWDKSIKLPDFKGTTILSISSASPHKNFQILTYVTDYLENNYPNFAFRFVLTQTEEQMYYIPNRIKNHFVFLGKVSIRQCPFLYKQSDIMFMPTLMECFTATYPEAMRMKIPIVTTDLEFAHSLCGNAACYYDAINPEAAAEALYKVANDKKYAQKLVEEGEKQLHVFDDYQQRVIKIVDILEQISIVS